MPGVIPDPGTICHSDARFYQDILEAAIWCDSSCVPPKCLLSSRMVLRVHLWITAMLRLNLFLKLSSTSA